jgi:dynein assembly factor 1, axonemal
MDRLNGLEKYFAEKDRKKLDAIAHEKNKCGIPEMTIEEIKQSCAENGGYQLPELNDKLYLHFRGFKKIENLEAYHQCKALWLDSNGLDKIEGLDALKEMRCLYMSKNLISKIEGFHNLAELIVLDLSANRIMKIENLSCCPNLDNLNISRNALSSLESIEHLKECKALRTLDIQNNRLEANEDILDLFAALPSLVTLSVNGNEVTKIQTFRKKTIYKIPALGFLDRPIEEVERLAAVAFIENGPEAEKEARTAYRDAQNKERTDRMTSFRTWQKEQQELRANLPEEEKVRMETENANRKQIREASAAEAAAIEQRAIQEIGIGKISARVTHLEAQGHSGPNVVFEAQKQLLQELDDERQVVEIDDNGMSLPPAPPTADTGLIDLDALDDDDDAPPIPPMEPSRGPLSGSIPGYEGYQGKLSEPKYSMSSSADEGRQLPEYSQAREAAKEAVIELAQQEEEPVESPEEIAKREAEEAAILKEKEEIAAAKKKVQEEENARQERIAESLAIYKAQKEAAAQAKKEGKSVNALGPRVTPVSSWDDAATIEKRNTASNSDNTVSSMQEQQVVELSSENSEQSVNRAIPAVGLYWTENMDIILAKQVQACVFDFDRVSSTMIKQFQNDKIDSEACRLRWADLDAGDGNPLETNFTCYVNDNMINHTKEKGHGAQPSFDSLSTMARSQFPSYLKAPNAFPSVTDDGSDSDGDDIENIGVNNKPVLTQE